MLKVGFARVDATPPLGDDLAGYFYCRLADGVRDPLYLNAVAIGNGEETILLLTMDCMAITTGRCDAVRALIAERTGVPADHVMIAALHQHTGPYPGVKSDKSDLGLLRDPAFDDVWNRKCADVSQMAIDDMKDATMSVAERELAEPIAFVRRYFTDQGVKSNPNTDKVTLMGRCAEADNTMRLLRFSREGANDIALVNFSTHPDVIGGNKWSADWPGFTRTFVETDLKDVSCIFFTGCQGDSNHYDFFKPKSERTRGGVGYLHSQYMGRTVADAVVAAWNETTPVSEDGISSAYRVVYTKTNLDGLEYYDEAVSWLKLYREREEKEGIRQTIPHPYIQSLAHACRLVKLREASLFQTVPLTVMKVGGVRFVGFGGEPFTAYGKTVRDLVPDDIAFCSVCSNGYEGYFPSAEAFEQGGYEVLTSLLTDEVEQEIVNALKEMLASQAK